MLKNFMGQGGEPFVTELRIILQEPVLRLCDALARAIERDGLPWAFKNSPAGDAPADAQPAAAPVVATSEDVGTGVSSLNSPPAEHETVPPAAFFGKVAGQKPVYYTPERVQMMVDLRAVKTPWAEVLARLNMMPGPRIASVGSVQQKFFQSKGLLPAPRPIGELPPLPEPAVEPAPKEIPVTGAAGRPANMLKFTPERIQLMVDLEAEGLKRRDVLARLNALPGEPISSVDAVKAKIVQLRSQGKLPSPSLRPEPTVAPITGTPPRAVKSEVPHPKPPSNKKLDYLEADRAQIRSWAVPRGLLNEFGEFDLVEVNNRARALGLPPFVLKLPARATR